MNNTEYHPFAKFLHWSIVILVAIQFVTAGIMLGVHRNASPSFLINLHMSFGMLILPIALLLLFMRFFRPVFKPEMLAPTWQEKSAVALHYSLYLLLVLLPFSGWAFASARGWTVSIFGVFNLPALFAQGSSVGRTIGGMHSLLATLIGILIVGHIGAALYHYFVLKDSVLGRMLPWGKNTHEN